MNVKMLLCGYGHLSYMSALLFVSEGYCKHEAQNEIPVYTERV